MLVLDSVRSTLTRVAQLDNPRNDPESELVYVLGIMDVILTSCFVFEMSVKLVTLGLAFGENAYLKVRLSALLALSAGVLKRLAQ